MLFPKKNEKLVRFGQQKNDYYIARSDAGSKLTKAESFGVKVLSEDEFKAILE